MPKGIATVLAHGTLSVWGTIRPHLQSKENFNIDLFI